ncbi:helix-turn-helix domain-containing protein [Neptuniibacter sp. 2_MG-2023]|uniref:helix-turn-helix domain-containing protein n=1 Tax=Neptuniibacter sp. 2_MG-2023 TaxID=3062671 RepID=UPI0026E33ECA|nr:helix-turn-helix domain-containing protein [Neptuniibacter sp. 2_MG-2023]MDO6514040.1 helix-turn-helix domain-containing protein [Neptuniibacter sp. 2_MG-2023]
MNPFGMYLTTLRLKRRFKQKDLAKSLNVYSSYISEIESGKRNPPSSKVINSIADAMSLSKNETVQLNAYAEQSIKVFHVPDDLPMEGYSCMHKLRLSIKNLSAEQFNVLESMKNVNEAYRKRKRVQPVAYWQAGSS